MRFQDVRQGRFRSFDAMMTPQIAYEELMGE